MAAIPLIALLLLALVAVPIWALIVIGNLRADLQALKMRLTRLEEEVRGLRRPVPSQQAEPSPAPRIAAPVPRPAIVPAAATPPRVVVPPPPLPTPAAPAPVARVAPPAAATLPAAGRPRAWNAEQFVGARLFAWLGGLAGFLAVAFFVKYSFEHQLIPPAVRVTIGFLFGAGLVVAGLWIRSDRLRVTSHVLCATGVVSLYAVTFACHTVYQFGFFTPGPTFAVMALVTAGAFVLASQKRAQAVAILGLVGGFLTPWLVATGQDNPLGLFGYITLLDLGLVAVALHRRWGYLVPLAVTGTLLLQTGWLAEFFAASRAPLAMAISLGFSALFAVAAELSRQWRRPAAAISWSAAAVPLAAFASAGWFLTFPAISERAALLFGFIFAADGLLLLLAGRDQLVGRVDLLGGTIVFALLGIWTSTRLTPGLLTVALLACVGFAILHTAFPFLLARRHPGQDGRWSHLAPPLALVLMFLPLLRLADVPFSFWPAVLVINAVAVGLALLTTSVVGVAAVVVLTGLVTAVAILRAPPMALVPFDLLAVVGGFALFFFAAILLCRRRLVPPAPDGIAAGKDVPGIDLVAALSTLLPFVLLVLMSGRLEFPNPGPVFGVAALLVVLVLLLTRLLTLEWLPAGGLAGVTLLEYCWHGQHFSVGFAGIVLAWYVAFHLGFAGYPFLFRRRFAGLTGPWAVAAASGLAVFPLVHQLVRAAWPNDLMGVLPALFALPPIAALLAVVRLEAPQPAQRLNRIAWCAGVALFFLTLVIPIQFKRQWITIGWALEGVALIWLFRRVAHAGLRATGFGLLVIAFVRLALNPAVLAYHPRATVAIWNWYLYAYGVVTFALFAGARRLQSKAGPVQVLGLPAAGVLNALGAVLGFLLLNIEIADYFSPSGSTLTFKFSGSFARDMAYTISWALYALLVLGAGIWHRARPARLAAIGLLGVTLLKLFLHDLAQLNQLYRVGALVGVAAVAIVASYLYQRFVPPGDECDAPGT